MPRKVSKAEYRRRALKAWETKRKKAKAALKAKKNSKIRGLEVHA